MTPWRVSIVAAIGAFLLLFVIFELIRRRRLTERYALLWIVTGLVILVVLLHYSTVISRLSDQNTILAQRLALLEQQLRESDEP